MKRNCEFIDLGEFEMTSPVMRVSDPVTSVMSGAVAPLTIASSGLGRQAF